MLNALSVIALLVSQQSGAFSLELPRPLSYQTTVDVLCGKQHITIKIANEGFTSRAESKANGKYIAFSSVEGVLGSSAAMRIISVQPLTCNASGGLTIAVSGVDMKPKSKTFGTEVTRFFNSLVR